MDIEKEGAYPAGWAGRLTTDTGGILHEKVCCIQFRSGGHGQRCPDYLASGFREQAVHFFSSSVSFLFFVPRVRDRSRAPGAFFVISSVLPM
jgi:hypothetical protein